MGLTVVAASGQAWVAPVVAASLTRSEEREQDEGGSNHANRKATEYVSVMEKRGYRRPTKSASLAKKPMRVGSLAYNMFEFAYTETAGPPRRHHVLMPMGSEVARQ